MKHSNKYNKVLGLAIAALAFTACSDDWDNHYDVQPHGEGTLWQSIAADENLSNFKSVLEACGYDAILNGSQVLTVFAPTNENLTDEQTAEWIALYNENKNGKDDENPTIKEFVRNHIALYNHSVSSSSDTPIMMMNGKNVPLTATTFGGKQIVTNNQLHKNGVLFTLNAPLDYEANVFEMLRKHDDLDSLAAFLYSYNEYEFLPDESVEGEIVNGQMTYLDSVTRLQNDMFSYLGKINNEDSSYWMVAPTNEVWAELIGEYAKYFVYAAPASETAAEKHKRDSMAYAETRMALLRGTVFSRSRNLSLFENEAGDSIVSTNAYPYSYRKLIYGSADAVYYQYYNPYTTGGVLNGTENLECSNGRVYKASTWSIDKTQTFCQNILIEAEYSSNQEPDTLTNSKTEPLESVGVPTYNPLYNQISNHAFALVTPASLSVNPSATFYIDNVLSNQPYDIDLVMLPATASDTAATASQRLPNLVRVSLTYTNEQDKTKSETLLSSAEVLFDRDGDGFDTPDTLRVATGYTFPTCAWGLSSGVHKNKLTIESRVTNKQKDTYSRTLRVDCIILRPHKEEVDN